MVRKSYGDFWADEIRFVAKALVGEENFYDISPNKSNNYCCGGGGGALQAPYKRKSVWPTVKLKMNR